MVKIINSNNNALVIAKQVAALLSRLMIVLFLVFSFSLVVFDKFKPEIFNPVRMQIIDFAYPFISVANKSFNAVRNVVNRVGDIIDASDDKAKEILAEQELIKLKMKLYTVSEENRKLKKLLNYLPEKDKKYYSARIISTNPTPYVQQSIIESDNIDFIERDDIVVGNKGLVGRVFNKGSYTAEILLVIDKRSNVPVFLRSSGERAILKGNGTKNPVLSFTLNTKNMIVGEEIVTSGDGGVFPPNIPVGYIKKISKDTVIIETFTNWNTLEYVFIIK